MDWEFLLRYAGQYTVLFGGGTVAVAYLLPKPFGPYALLGAVAVGILLFGRAALAGGGRKPESDARSVGLDLAGSGSDRANAEGSASGTAGAGSVFYALGLMVFGGLAIVTLL